jgi:hypothetical protein
MKRIILSTVVLLVFSLAIMVFQVSCKKDAVAQNQPYKLPIATIKTLGGVIVDGVTLKIDEKGVLSTTGDVVILNPIEDNFIVYGHETNDARPDNGELNIGEIWIMNEDGSGKTKVNISIPPNQYVNIHAGMRVTRQGKILFIADTDAKSNDHPEVHIIYQCDKDGKNLKVMAQHDDDFFTL